MVTNYGGLVACRFFLGITEAPVRKTPEMGVGNMLKATKRRFSSIPAPYTCFQFSTPGKVCSVVQLGLEAVTKV